MTRPISAKRSSIHAVLFVAAGTVLRTVGAFASDLDVQFNRDIRPILSDNCFQCHGPDPENREADLRLDVRESVFSEREGRRPAVPGDPRQSEIFRRITAVDDGERMPPPDLGRPLSDEQIDLIRRWLHQGARWQEHWSFVRPVRPTYPAVKRREACRNGIDVFVLARLERLGLEFAPRASKSTLIRRVCLDLTGLPPTPEEVDAFLEDDSPSAYEKVVDRLLSSCRYGERTASMWLDAARYADTSGYQNDGPRSMWRWRDWVINSFNQDMPFDRFTIQQIAGDMLSNATLNQRIATAFNRNHRSNSEGGIIPAEYQVENVVDRVDTTATVWLGLTMGCARCHDHKYDPISQKEFYQVFAYFNNIPENGRAVKEGNSPPMMMAPTPRQQQQLTRLEARITSARKKHESLGDRFDTELAAWEKSINIDTPLEGQPHRAQVAHFPLDADIRQHTSRSIAKKRSHTNDESDGPRAPRFVGSPGVSAPGVLGEAAEFDGQRFIDAGDHGAFGYHDRFSVGAWIRVEKDGGGIVVSRMIDEAEESGWSLSVVNGRLRANLVKRWLDDSIRLETVRPLVPGRWHAVMLTYDGTRDAKECTIYVDGIAQAIIAHYDFLNQSFAVDQPLRIGGGGGPKGRFRGWIDDVRIFDDALSPDSVAALSVREAIHEIVATPLALRTAAQTEKLRRHFLEHHASKPIQTASETLAALRREKRKLEESIPTVMVMIEMEQPRPTYILDRGQYDRPGERVAPGVPSVLSALPSSAANNRLGFARWLVDRSNPLTARVTVNRYWQALFGAGLVTTAEDFGTQGAPPSHPQLLDWLAVEFMNNGWSVKHVLRTIVTSATYCQSSQVTPRLNERDPNNRWLARGPRFRLSASMIRDQSLAVSGRLTERIGGPSVRPYQPAGLWKEIATDTNYEQSHGADLYRRSLYTYWKRTVAPPNMLILDASSREACSVRHVRTNTPLQALALMNDVTFCEAARLFAERVMSADGKTQSDRLRLAFRLATARQPVAAEMRLLLSALEHHLLHFTKDNTAAMQLISTGESPRDERFSASELAAYTTVCSLILNLDEFVTKE